MERGEKGREKKDGRRGDERDTMVLRKPNQRIELGMVSDQSCGLPSSILPLLGGRCSPSPR